MLERIRIANRLRWGQTERLIQPGDYHAVIAGKWALILIEGQEEKIGSEFWRRISALEQLAEEAG